MEPEPASPLDAPSAASSAALSPLVRLAWVALIVTTLGVCYFSHLGAIGFVGPDEPRYAWIARDMAETGDWVTPRLYGKPWFEKPPLYYWSAALSFEMFGVSETAARLPSAIAALLATLALAWLAWRLYGAETARWLLLLLPASVGMLGFSHAASTDMLFSSTLTLALVAACVVVRLVSERMWVACVLFGFFLGLAVLAKGPAAVMLLGGAVFFWALFTKRWRDAFRLFHPLALVVFFATALPWYVICARRNPDFFHVFIIEHNFKRYLTPEFQHVQPFWYYGTVLVVAFLPWTVLLLWSLISGSLHLWRTRKISDGTLLLLSWSAFTVLFFTISRSKLPGYILPAIPVIACLMASRLESGNSSRAKTFSVLAAAFVFAAGYVLTGLFTLHKSDAPSFRAAEAVGWILASLAIANLLFGAGNWLQMRLKSAKLLTPLSVVPILAAVIAAPGFVPAFSIGDPSGKTLAEEIRRAEVPVASLAAEHPTKRGQRYSLSFYLRQEVPEWDGKSPYEGYVFSGRHLVASREGVQVNFEEVPFDVAKTGYFLYRVRPKSLDATSGGKTE